MFAKYIPIMTAKQLLMQDWILSEIEKRGLQFLLTEDQRKQEYTRWLKKPEAYKQRVRNINRENAAKGVE